MGAQVARHNSKIIRSAQNGPARTPPSCNCQKSRIDECPLPGACNQDGVVYQATVKSRGGEETYIGLAKNFKKRFGGHKRTLQTKREEGKTTLSTHFWKEIEAGGEPTI